MCLLLSSVSLVNINQDNQSLLSLQVCQDNLDNQDRILSTLVNPLLSSTMVSQCGSTQVLVDLVVVISTSISIYPMVNLSLLDLVPLVNLVNQDSLGYLLDNLHNLDNPVSLVSLDNLVIL